MPAHPGTEAKFLKGIRTSCCCTGRSCARYTSAPLSSDALLQYGVMSKRVFALWVWPSALFFVMHSWHKRKILSGTNGMQGGIERPSFPASFMNLFFLIASLLTQTHTNTRGLALKPHPSPLVGIESPVPLRWGWGGGRSCIKYFV